MNNMEKIDYPDLYFYDEVNKVLQAKNKEKEDEDTREKELERSQQNALLEKKKEEWKMQDEADAEARKQKRLEVGLSELTPDIGWEKGKDIISKYLKAAGGRELNDDEIRAVSDWIPNQKKTSSVLRDVNAWPDNKDRNATFRKICTWMEEAEAEEIMNKLKTN